MSLTKVRNVLDVTADTMADLLSMKHKKGSVQLLGFHEKGDGGGGVFYWDADESTENHNGGTIIAGNKDVSEATWGAGGATTWFDAPAVTTGCWKREFSGAVNVKWFGAKGDGVTDDSTACQNAIDFVESQGAGGVYFPMSEYRLSATLRVKARGMRLFGDGLENSALLVDGGVTAILIQANIGASAVNEGVDNLEFRPSGQGVGTTVGVRIRQSSRKIFISYCAMRNMDYGIIVNDSWTVFVENCHINDNDRNIAIYRTVTDNISPTTVYITKNSIMNFASGKGYSLSIGEPGQDDFQAGEQCSTLVVSENVMDGSHCFQNGATNVHWVRNHAENKRMDNQPFLLVEGISEAQHFLGNTVWNYDFAVAYLGTSYENITLRGNWFRNILYTAVRIPNSFNRPNIIENNTFKNVGKEYELAIRTSTNEYSEKACGIEANAFRLAGNSIKFLSALPTTGRIKHGDQFIIRDNTTAADRSYFFEAGGNVSTALGITNVGAVSTSGDTDQASNTVTPLDISAFETGDRLIITGADTAGGNLACVIITIDYAAGTFKTNPSIKTTTVGTTIEFDGANSSNFRQIAKGSAAANLDVVGSENGISGRFQSDISKTIPNGTSTLETLPGRSCFMVYIRDTTNSASFITAIVATALSGGFIDVRIDQSNGFSIAMSGRDLQITNTLSSRNYAYSILQIAS